MGIDDAAVFVIELDPVFAFVDQVSSLACTWRERFWLEEPGVSPSSRR